MENNAANLAAPTEAQDRRSAAEAPLTETPGQLVREAQQLVEAANAILRAAVVAERTRETSWQDIGEVLGVNKSTAHGRFASAMEEFVDAAEAGSTDGPRDRATRNLSRAWDEALMIIARRGQRGEVMQVADLITRGPEAAAVEVEHAGDGNSNEGAEEATTDARWSINGSWSSPWPMISLAPPSARWTTRNTSWSKTFKNGIAHYSLLNPQAADWWSTASDASELERALKTIVHIYCPQLPEADVDSALEETLQRILNDHAHGRDEGGPDASATDAEQRTRASLKAIEDRVTEASRKLDEIEARQAVAERAIQEVLGAYKATVEKQSAVPMVPVDPHAHLGHGPEDDTHT